VRQTLQVARKGANKTQVKIAEYLGISPRYYQKIEAGENIGNVHIWDALEALFDFKIPQRELRENITQ
jgi:transcriptional regulator with XRE-family HTH domain